MILNMLPVIVKLGTLVDLTCGAWFFAPPGVELIVLGVLMPFPVVLATK